MKQNTEFSDFFDENSKKLFGYLLKMSGNREDAEDLFQETFIKYARAYPHQKSPSLLFTVAKSLFIDMVRRIRQTDETEIDSVAGGTDPENNLLEKRAENRVLRLLARLSEEEREIISLSGQDGLRYEEIAKILNMTVPNVKIMIHRTRLKLKKMMEAEDE